MWSKKTLRVIGDISEVKGLSGLIDEAFEFGCYDLVRLRYFD